MFNADKLRELREKANLTTVELGPKVGTTQQSISNWESRLFVPNANCLKNIADFFGVPMEAFFEGEDTGEARADKNDERGR